MDYNTPGFESILDEVYDAALINLFDFDFEAVFSYKTESLRLSDQLAELRKKDLNWIRQQLNIPNVSTLNKEELRQALAAKIPLYLEKTLKYLTKYNYDMLSYFIQANRQDFLIENYMLEDLELAAFFFSYGIAFPALSEQGLHIFFPDSTINLLKGKLQTPKIAETAARNEEIILNSWTLLHFYGAASFSDLYKILKNYIKVDFSFDFYHRLLEINSGFHNPFHTPGSALALKEVYDPEELYSEQRERGFDYAAIPRIEFEAVRKKEEHVFNFAQRRMAKYLRNNFEIKKEQADAMTHYIYYLVQNGFALTEISKEFKGLFDLERTEDIKELLDLVTDINNQTRLWVLRGHRPQEFGI